MSDTDQSLSDHDLLIRIDSKLDGVIEAKNDHETRLRTLEDKAEHTVTGKQLWAGLVGVAVLISTATPTIMTIIGRH